MFRAEFATQLVTHPEKTKEQREFILDAISKTTTDIYDKTDPEKVARSHQIGMDLDVKAMSLFEPKKAAAILATIFSQRMLPHRRQLRAARC